MQTLKFLPLVFALTGGVSLAQQQSVLPFLPPHTVMAVSVPDLNASIGEFSEMPLAKMWGEQDVQNFLADAREQAKVQIEALMKKAREMHAQGAFPVDPDKLLNLRMRGGTFALTKLSIKEGDFGPMPSVGVILHLDFGENAEQWAGLIQMGLGLLTQQAGDHMTREEFKVGDTNVVSMVPNDAPPGLEMSLNIAMLKNGIMIGTLKNEVRAIIESMQAAKPSLGSTDRYKECVKHLMAEGAEAEVFMRPDQFIDFGVSMLGMAAKQSSELEWLDTDGLGRAIDALGLRSIQSIGGASTYQGGKAITTSYAVAPAPDRKGLLAGADKNLDLSFLKWVPKDAVSFSGATMDMMSLHDGLMAALKAYDDKIAEEAMTHLAGMEKAIGFNIREDFFGALGNTVITWSMPMATVASPPEMAILVKVNDQEKIVKVLKSLTGMSNGMVDLEEADKRGVKTYQFRVNFDPSNGMGMNPFDVINPTFAFKGGYLVAGFSPSDIKRVFARMDRTDDDPKSDIRGNKEFAAYADKLPKDVQSLSFTDWKANFESYYQLLTSVLAFVPMNESVPIDMSMLPDAGTLTKHLFGQLTYTKADALGFESTSISPFGPEIAVLACAAIAGGVAVFAGMRGRF